MEPSQSHFHMGGMLKYAIFQALFNKHLNNSSIDDKGSTFKTSPFILLSFSCILDEILSDSVVKPLFEGVLRLGVFFNDHLKGTSNFHSEQSIVFLMVLFSNFHSCLSTGQIFRMFVHMTRARKILLIDKLKGYSILAIAEKLPDDGKIFACAEAPYLGVNSQEAFDYSSDGKKISMREGPVADTLEVKSSGRGVWDLLCRAH